MRAIYRIWPDFDVSAFITRSIATVKADAARNSFSALGENITWAVLDTGIDATHKHFEQNGNLKGPVQHRDFTQPDDKLASRSRIPTDTARMSLVYSPANVARKVKSYGSWRSIGTKRTISSLRSLRSIALVE